MAPLRIIVPKDRADEYDAVVRYFAGVLDCEVVLDRRRGERRAGQAGYDGAERRRGDRRGEHLESNVVVLSAPAGPAGTHEGDTGEG